MEPILTDGIHIGEIPSQRTSDILEACNAIGEKFLQNNENKNGCIVSHRPTIADFAILPILRSMKITEHVGWKLSQIVDAYTERCMRIIPNMRECFIPLEAHINHMSPRIINGEASLQLTKVLEDTQKQSYIVSIFKDGQAKTRSEEWAATKLQARFRGYLARKTRKSLVVSATTFQAAWRGYYFRKQKKSATKLQAHFRGYQARKHISKPRRGANKRASSSEKSKYVYYFEKN